MTNQIQLTLGPQTAQLRDAQSGSLIGRIDAGYQAMIDQHFSRSPLDAGGLERAIEWTEDRIQMARLSIPAGATLITQEADVHWLAQIAGLQCAQPLLYRDAVEQVFSRLVLQAFGQAPQQHNLTDNPRLLATVVLLREMLHHLRFEHIQVNAAGVAGQA